ncbi:MAG: Integral rane protein [Clostridiales bacterium]|jgi:CrcB protein|nr:Integral rane protein [Clostridiales bacterium]
MDYLLVGLGGCIGSIARYTVGKYFLKFWKEPFPLPTFIINITGAFLLGIVSNMGLDKNYMLLLADGFLGAYTTFSTFMYEGLGLFKNKRKLLASIYLFVSIFAGIAGYAAAELLI